MRAGPDREVAGGQPPWVLPGTLSLPPVDHPVPAAVIVRGSGPLDRKGIVGPTRPGG